MDLTYSDVERIAQITCSNRGLLMLATRTNRWTSSASASTLCHTWSMMVQEYFLADNEAEQTLFHELFHYAILIPLHALRLEACYSQLEDHAILVTDCLCTAHSSAERL